MFTCQEVSVVGGSLQVFEWKQQESPSDDHVLDDFLVWEPETLSPLHVGRENSHVIGHLRGGGGCSVLVFQHTIEQLLLPVRRPLKREKIPLAFR
jgi:hypothetical protein